MAEGHKTMVWRPNTCCICDQYRSGETRAKEHRIYYFGATHASESLHMVDGFFDGPRILIFAGGLPGHATEAHTQPEVAD